MAIASVLAGECLRLYCETEARANEVSNVSGRTSKDRGTLSGKLIVLELLGGPSFLERGVPSPGRRKPTRLAADFIHALLFSALLDFVDDTGVI